MCKMIVLLWLYSNRMNRLTFRVTKVIDDKQSYAVFPADNHVEHLNMILTKIGVRAANTRVH